MFPFQPSFPYLPNQTQVEGSNFSAPQQAISSNQCLTNSSNIVSSSNPLNFSQLHNPQAPPFPLNVSNTHVSNFNGSFAAMPNTHFLNVASHQLQLQNSHVGRPFLGSGPYDLTQPSGQLTPLNTLQNLNSVMTSPQCGQFLNFSQNLNQLQSMQQQQGQLFVHNQNRGLQPFLPANMFNPHNQLQHMSQATVFPQSQFVQNPVTSSQGLPYGPSLGCSNQGFLNLGSQTSTFLMNQQSGLVNSNLDASQNAQSHHGFIPTGTGQNTSLPNGPVQMQQTQKDVQPGGQQCSKGSNTKDGGNNISNSSHRNHHIKSITRNHPESVRKESPNPGFQKSKFQPRENAKGNFRSFNGKGGKGQRNVGQRKSHLINSTNQTRMECKRSIPLNYTEQEIQQWREERKKNHPMKSNNEKKSADKQTHSEDIDENATKRRQQLKEILAKQAELGLEVAELPPNYLTDSENQVCGKEEESRINDKKARFQNKYNKRGKRGNSNRFGKKHKSNQEGLFAQPDSYKRKPTLLQKLLSADIKRDNSHLLQVFRFMVTNSFFKDWPEKPLEFPLVTVKDGDCKSKIIEDKPSLLHDDRNSLIQDDEDDDENEVEVEDIGVIDSIRQTTLELEGEEGEITD